MKALARTSKGGSVELAPAYYDDADTIDVMGVMGVLWRRKWLILLCVCLGTMAGWLYGKTRVPEYTARSSVVIEPRETNVLDVKKVLSGLIVDQATVATEMSILTSRANYVRVMEDLGLFDDPEFNPALAEEEERELPPFLQEPVDKLLSWMPDRWLIATGLAREPLEMLESDAPELTRAIAVDRFASGVEIANDGASYVIHVNYTAEEPEKAALIANRLAEVYLDSQLKTKLYATDRASGFLEGRIESMREDVQKAGEAVARFKAENGLLDTQGVRLSEQEMGDLNKELIMARGDLAEKQAKLQLVRELRGAGRSIDVMSDVVGSPVIIALRAEETTLLRQEAELASQFGPRHPRMQQLQRDKANLQAKVNAEIARIAGSLENDVRVVQARINTIEGQLNRIKGLNVKDQQQIVKLQELERRAETSRQIYQNFLQRYQETSEQEKLVEPDARIVAVASPPTAPSTPSPRLFLLGGFTVALLGGSLLALLLERLDKGIRSSREVEALLGLSTLALVPRLERLRRGQKPYQYLVDKPLSAYSEAIRSVYTAIRLGSVDRPSKLVLVTSSLPEEGKTTLAVSLATLAARSNRKVLLIDLDLRHPSVHRELGWQVPAGLVEHMAGDRLLEEVIQHDAETGLDFLPIRAQTTNPMDLLESQKLRELLETCRQRYELVILDSAPVASVTDARLLSIMVDKVVFVLQWHQTVASAAQDSVRALREAGADIAGTVLTQVDLARHAQYGYGDIGQYYARSRKYYVD
ncbi:polysaccharide biosynthesis tyrosine autokinase [Geminicoccaceae bacterium 1502E]|nr:polysaccharide biosynthesis tyrosine autokinase [Geminicoccaceae bacterium 1502E]